MSTRRGSWASVRFAIVIALMIGAASVGLYPGGTVRDKSSCGYSFTHNFLSDLGSTVAINGERNAAGAVLMSVSLVILVVALAGSVVATVRLLSAAPGARAFARLAVLAGGLVCVGFLGVALMPEDRAPRLHMLSAMVAFRSFVVATALLAIATARDRRFRRRATVGWVMLTVLLAGFIAMGHMGPSTDTEHGLVTQVIAQKIMAVTALVVLWIEGREAEVASASRIEALD